MEKEFEVIRPSKLRHINIFINELEYRISHLHPEFEIIYTISNPLTVTFPGKVVRLRQGSAMIINPSQVHMLEKERKSSVFLCMQISPNLFRDVCPAFASLRFSGYDITENDGRDEILSTLLQAARSYYENDDMDALETISLVAHLFYVLSKKIPSHFLSPKEKEAEEENINRISRLLEFIDANYTHKINLSDFARQEGLSLSYLSHFSKKVLSEPFQDYVNSLRFNYAKKLLATGTHSLAEAAFESGFSDPRYLSRAFEKRMGMKASEYRKSYTESDDEEVSVHISAHSLERYYSRRKSIDLLDKLLKYNVNI